MITATATLRSNISVTAELVSKQVGSCADATVTNQAEDYSLSIASGATEKLPFGKVKNKDGNDVQVDYIPAADGYIFEETACPASLEVTVALSNTTPRYDDTITITATATGATSYTFYLPVQDGSTQVVTQASNTYNWKVKKYGSFTVVVTATDGSNSGVGSASGTTSGDVDADAFVVAHNAATGGTMDATMQDNALGFFLRLKGVNTTFYEDVFTQLLAANAELYPMIPDDVSGASVAGYSINAIDPTRNGTMVGFVPADATLTGLTGGSGKYMIMNNAPSDYGQNNVGVDAYIRSQSGFTISIGAGDGGASTNTNGIYLFGAGSGDNLQVKCNCDFLQISATAAIQSFNKKMITVQRNGTKGAGVYQNAELFATNSHPNQYAPSSNVFYGMALNNSGTAQNNFTGSVSMLCNRPYLEECALFTLYEAVEWLQVQLSRNV